MTKYALAATQRFFYLSSNGVSAVIEALCQLFCHKNYLLQNNTVVDIACGRYFKILGFFVYLLKGVSMFQTLFNLIVINQGTRKTLFHYVFYNL